MARPTTSQPNRSRAAAPRRERSLGRIAAAAIPAGLVAIGGLLLFDPSGRLGLGPASLAGFATSIAATLLLFGAAFALLGPIVDLVVAWGDATPESERRRDGDGGDGAFLDLLGFGDCGDGDGCGD